MPVSSDNTPPAGPFAPYLLQPNISDATGHRWGFDLSGLYSAAGGYSATGADGSQLSFNVGGYSSAMCIPPFGAPRNWGVGVLSWANASIVPPANGCSATNATHGLSCTNPCMVVGISAPSAIALANPANGATGGVVLTWYNAQGTLPHSPVPQCGLDPVTGDAGNVLFTLTLACDASVPATTLAGVAYTRPDTCTVAATARTAAACGK